MVVLHVHPWQEENGDRSDDHPLPRPPTRPDTTNPIKEIEFFGFQDLASDYYQVKREVIDINNYILSRSLSFYLFDPFKEINDNNFDDATGKTFS